MAGNIDWGEYEGGLYFFDKETGKTVLELSYNDLQPKMGGNNWTDIRVSGSSAKSGAGLKAPGFDKFRDDGAGSDGVFTYAFDKAAEEEVLFAVQIPHSYEPGTELRPHVHWSPGASEHTGTCRWALEYTIASYGKAFPVTKTIIMDDAGGGVAYAHQIADGADIPGTDIKESAMLICRLYRDATNAADTFDADAFLLEFDLHFKQNKLGTYPEYPS